MFNEATFSLTPISFFQVDATCQKLKGAFPHLCSKNLEYYALPDSSALCDESPFAEVAIGWSPEGIEFYAKVLCPVEKMRYPEVSKGDSVELFIDTRDVKTSGYNTRFCHHFFFLPEPVEGRQAGEITQFRTEDKHDWCHPDDLLIKSTVQKKHYTMNIFIPAHCLTGYDPTQFERFGFTYRINCYNESAQHFSVSTLDFPIEQHSSLWATTRMVT